MSGECQVNVKSQSELDIGGRETCISVFYPSNSKFRPTQKILLDDIFQPYFQILTSNSIKILRFYKIAQKDKK